MNLIKLPQLELLYYLKKSDPVRWKTTADGELCWRNNPRSLFRKYKELVTEFSNHQLGRDYLGIPNFGKNISLFLPSGYQVKTFEGKKYEEYYSKIYSRPVFAPKLYPALAKLDFYLPWIKDFNEALEMLYWATGLRKYDVRFGIPLAARQTMFYEMPPVYPDANPETTSVDGYVGRLNQDETFSAIRSGAGTHGGPSADPIYTGFLQASSTTNQFTHNIRGAYLYDASSLPDGATISASVLSLYVTVNSSGFGDNSFDIVSANPASNTNLIPSDYGTLGTTSFANKASTAISINVYNAWTLDANGRANISTTGISKFGVKINWDLIGSFTGIWQSGFLNALYVTPADAGSNKPKLVNTYNAVSLTITEHLTITDTVARNLNRTISEVIKITDTILKAPTRIISEVITLVDTVIKGRAKTIEETITVQDSVTPKVTGKILTEQITVNDSIAKSVGKVITERITIVDTIVRRLGKIITEHITINDLIWAKFVRAGGVFSKAAATAASWVKQVATSGGFVKQTPPAGGFSKQSPTSSTWDRQRGHAR